MSAAGAMAVFFDARTQGYRIPDGAFEAPASPLLELQTRQPEGPERITNTRSVLTRGPLAKLLTWHAVDAASDAQILRFHSAAYLDELKAADRNGRYFSSTTYLAPDGLNAVRLAAGAAIGAARHVMGGRGELAYALGRPPSHHAQPDRADGYCFVNGVALAALEALQLGAKRVAVIDWDVHHGNGTQEGFYERGDVLTISLHMDHGAWGESHPQSGGVEEIGRGAGEGWNLNLPLAFGAGDRLYAQAFSRCVAPAVRRFAPDAIVLANGQDANQFDPNGRQVLSMAGFYGLAGQLRALAAEVCGGRVIMTQEGGYNAAYAPFCAHAVAAGLLGRPIGIEDPLAYYPEDEVAAETAVGALIARHPLLAE